MDYGVVAIFCIFSVIVGSASIFESELLDRKQKQLFFQLAIVIVFEIILDTISLCTDGTGILHYMYYKGIKIIEFSIAPCIPAICAKIVARKWFWRKIERVYIVLIVVNALMQIITFFVPFMFNVDDSATYNRTAFGYIYLAIMLVCYILIIIATQHTYIQNSENSHVLLLLMASLITIGIVIRIFVDKCNSDWLAISFSYFIFTIYYNNSYLKIDPTTSLLNRKAFDNRLTTINYDTVIVVLDINDFKKVNDEYGHPIGDWALFQVAESILNIYVRIAYCYRIGGDEFAVILKKGVMEELCEKTENYDINVAMEKIAKELDLELSKKGEKNSVLRGGVSQGHESYYLIQNVSQGDTYKTPQEVFKIADDRMYENKQKHKEEKTQIG